MHNQEDIRGLLKETFETFEAEPRRDVWENIQQEIHPEKRGIPWKYWAVAAAIALLLMVGVRIALNTESLEDSERMAQVEETTPLDTLPNQDGRAASSEAEADLPAPKIVEQLPTTPTMKTPSPISPDTQTDRGKQEVSNSSIAIHVPQERAESPEIALTEEMTTVTPQEVIAPAPRLVVLDRIIRENPQIDHTKSMLGSPGEIAQVPVMEKPQVRKKLRIGELTFDDVLLVASNTLKKTVTESPLDAEHEQAESGDEVKRLRVKIGPLTITRTQHRKTASL